MLRRYSALSDRPFFGNKIVKSVNFSLKWVISRVQKVIRDMLVDYKGQFHGHFSVSSSVSTFGFSESLIDPLVFNCEYLYILTHIMALDGFLSCSTIILIYLWCLAFCNCEGAFLMRTCDPGIEYAGASACKKKEQDMLIL